MLYGSNANVLKIMIIFKLVYISIYFPYVSVLLPGPLLKENLNCAAIYLLTPICLHKKVLVPGVIYFTHLEPVSKTGIFTCMFM